MAVPAATVIGINTCRKARKKDHDTEIQRRDYLQGKTNTFYHAGMIFWNLDHQQLDTVMPGIIA